MGNFISALRENYFGIDNAEKAFDLFIKTYDAKYPKAGLCLPKAREELMAFYYFPAPHW